MITPESFIAQFPEFSSLDPDVIQQYIDQSVFDFSPCAWAGQLNGINLIDLGQSYFVASQLFNQVVRVADTTQAAPYSSKTAGQVSNGYAVAAIDAGDPDALFMANKYGQQYLRLRNNLGGIATTTGGLFPSSVNFGAC